QEVNLGFNPTHLLTLRLQLAGSKYSGGPKVSNFYKQLIQRIEALPGVQSVGAVNNIFLEKVADSSSFTIEGVPNPPAAERVEVTIDSASPNYFRTMGVALLRGRDFSEQDSGENPVVIINETMARRFWAGKDPIGRRIIFGDPEGNPHWITIVGVVSDVRRTG